MWHCVVWQEGQVTEGGEGTAQGEEPTAQREEPTAQEETLAAEGEEPAVEGEEQVEGMAQITEEGELPPMEVPHSYHCLIVVNKLGRKDEFGNRIIKLQFCCSCHCSNDKLALWLSSRLEYLSQHAYTMPS